MTIRVRPADIEVPPDDPFQNDLLDRKPYIETLTGLLGAVQGPCVLALDSEWGGGKTTFLKLWAAHLRKEGFAVAEFNAWETDFSSEPFVALSSKLREQFEAAPPESLAETTKRFSEVAKRVALRTAPVAIRLLSQGLLDSGSLERLVADHLATRAEDRLKEFDEAQSSITEFKEILNEGAKRLSMPHKNRPLFVMIDELDRCRPSYAIELLEFAKHLFSVDKIIFVLAINQAQLLKSIEGVYGAGFDAKGYLRRFFDIDYQLPSPKRESFVMQTLRDIGFSEQFQGITGTFNLVPTMIAQMLAWSDLDLRRMEQAIHRLAVACTALDGNSYKAAAATSVAVVVRELDSSLYREFCLGNVDDKDLLYGLWSNGDLESMQYTSEGYLFQSIVSNWWFELERQAGREMQGWGASGLLKHLEEKRTAIYERMNEANKGGVWKEFTEEERKEIRRVDAVVEATQELHTVSGQLHLKTVIERIECLPSS